MQTLFRLSAAFGLFILAGCATPATRVTYDRQINFSDFQTFGWAPSADLGSAILPPVRVALTASIENELTARGWQHVEANTVPQVYVTYRLKNAGKNASPTNSAAALPLAPARLPLGEYRQAEFQREQAALPSAAGRFGRSGALVVDLFDAKQARVIWHGEGVRSLDGAEENGAVAHAAVHELFAGFPLQSHDVR